MRKCSNGLWETLAVFCQPLGCASVMYLRFGYSSEWGLPGHAVTRACASSPANRWRTDTDRAPGSLQLLEASAWHEKQTCFQTTAEAVVPPGTGWRGFARCRGVPVLPLQSPSCLTLWRTQLVAVPHRFILFTPIIINNNPITHLNLGAYLHLKLIPGYHQAWIWKEIFFLNNHTEKAALE